MYKRQLLILASLPTSTLLPTVKSATDSETVFWRLNALYAIISTKSPLIANVEAKLTVSDAALVVMAIPTPPTNVNVSVVESATTLSCPLTAIVWNRFCDPPPPPVLIVIVLVVPIPLAVTPAPTKLRAVAAVASDVPSS